MLRLSALFALFTLAPFGTQAAQIAPASMPTSASECLPELRLAERSPGLPAGLLRSIAAVESGRADPRTGQIAPWPWTINVAGTGYFFATKLEAMTAVQHYQALGIQSIDVGCMQINLMHHPLAFASLDEAFDPARNVAYGARFLRTLYAELRAWPDAVAAYHSRNAELGVPYAERVLGLSPSDAGSANRRSRLADADPNHTPEFNRRLREAAEDHARLLARTGASAPPAPARAAARARFAALR